MRESGIDEQQIKEYEDLTNNKPTTEQIHERKNELKKLRGIMFFEELKAKRQKKIKSKKFRKIMKRKKEKHIEETEETIQKERVKAEKQRAIERTRLRHSNSSNWTKRMQRIGLSKDAEIKDQLKQQKEIEKNLKKKMGVSESESESENEEEVGETLKEDTGVASMLFMKRAIEKQKKEAQTLKEEMEEFENDLNSKKKKAVDSEYDVVNKHKSKILQKKSKNISELNENISHTVSHKTSFKGNLEVKSSQPEKQLFQVQSFPEIDDKEEEKERIEFSKILNKTQISIDPENKFSLAQEESENEDENQSGDSDGEEVQEEEEIKKPTFTAGNDEEESSEKEEETLQDNPWINSTSNEKSSAKKSPKESVSNPWIVSEGKTKNSKEETTKSKKKNKKEEKVTISNQEDLFKEASKNDEQKGSFDLLDSSNYKQKELVESAFAVDDVAEEFETEREQVLNGDKKEDQDEQTLPGWGSWVGEGVVNRKRKTPSKKEFGPQKDKNQVVKEHCNKRVIKRSSGLPEHAKKYLVTELPHPFNSLSEYKLSMGRNVGVEYNTRSIFKDLIKPDVKVHDGAFIQPIEWDHKKQNLSKKEKEKNKQKRQKRIPKNLKK